MTRSSTQPPNTPSPSPAERWPGWMRRAALAAGAVLLGGLACGEDSTGPPPPPPPSAVVATVTVSPEDGTVAQGQNLQLVAEAFDADGRRMTGVEFSWRSHDPSLARVDSAGLVLGIAPGAATITAAVGTVNGRSHVRVVHRHRAALEAIYHSLNGPEWENNENWLTDAPVGEWYGVTTRGSGSTIVELYLNQGVGSIPPELGLLHGLELLNLNFARLLGPIPPELGNLSNLKDLRLYQTGVSGRIPSELGKLRNLELLKLDRNRLTGPIPPELGNLENLVALQLHHNELTGPIPPELGGLDSLVTLQLSDNELTGPVPPELGNLSNLWRLWIFHNNLTGPLPRALLNTLATPGSQFEWRGVYDADSPCAPGTSEFIEWLARQQDLLGARGPFCNAADRAALDDLFDLTGGGNWTESDGWRVAERALDEWHGVSADSLGHVTALRLSNNRLTGELPDVFGRLTRLTEVRLDGNRLGGRLPLSLTRLPLEEFHYSGTNLCEPPDDHFQTWLARISSHTGTGIECEPLTDRAVLTALYNATDGANWEYNGYWLADVPLGAWYGVRTDDSGRVVELDLSYNDLAGAIPPELGQLSKLEELRLGGNSLTGVIPPEFGDLSDLKQLGLEWNGHTGLIPPELGNLSSLETVNLRGNNFMGAIPSELGGLSQLEMLYLDNNKLTGAIPSELGNLSNVRGIFLHGNELTGSIPSELGDLSQLRELVLGYNDLAGAIPAALGDLSNLQDLWFKENDLTGAIPAELGRLGSLEALDLSFNDLSGTLPAELGRLESLEQLDLSFNDLAGTLAPELGGLTRLEDLNVSGNRGLLGAVPASMTGIRLESLFALDTDLCVPREPRFLDWSTTIARKRIAFCDGGETAAYLTQAVQSRTHPVPLVAGEQALLRVFLTATKATTEELPPVRARFYVDGTERHVAEISAKSTPIPEEVSEGDLSKSQNAEIPGEIVQPGLEMVIEVDPDGTLDPGLGVPGRIPEAGRLALDVRRMPPLDLTVIPFLARSRPDSAVVDAAAGMAADPEGHELLEHTRILLPVGELGVTAHEPVVSTSVNTWDLAGQIGTIRAVEGERGHHVGLIGEGFDGPAYGYIGGRLSVSGLSSQTLAHELGHNMHLYHAPCGGAGGPDTSFPVPNGSIGAYGYDFRTGEVVGRSWPDLMSYCHPRWISDYHFSNALGYRLLDEGGAASAVAAPPTRALLVWGGVDPDGEAFLDPAFVVDAPVALPDSAGAYAVTGRDAEGAELFSLSFAMPVLADAEGASSFVFAVPAEAAWEGRLASVTLSGPDGEAVLDGETNRPMAILRDPASGQVRGFFSELPQDVGTAGAAAVAIEAEPDLRVLFSRGIPDAAAWRR